MKSLWKCSLLACLFPILLSCSEDQVPQPPQETKKELPPNPPGTQFVKGQASITLKSQSWAQPLHHLQIVLMSQDAIPAIKKIRETQWLEKASRANFGDGYNNLDLVSMGLEAKKRSLIPEPAEADSQGHYAIPAVKPGKYALYAQYKSRYAAGYWLIPIEVKNGEDTILDLNNDNMTEVFNRFKDTP